MKKKYSFEEFVDLIKSRVSQIEFESEKYQVILKYYNEKEQMGEITVTYKDKTIINFEYYVSTIMVSSSKITTAGIIVLTNMEYPEWYQNYLNRGEKEDVIVDDLLRAHQGNGCSHDLEFYLAKYLPLGESELKKIISESFQEYHINPDDILFDTFSQSYVIPLELSNIFAQNCDNSTVDKNGSIRLYKYMSLDTYRCILNNRTFRMNSIVSMNDIYEGEWINHLLFGGSRINDDNELRTSYLENRKLLVASFSGNCDDASMWRYYAENGSGVCLCVECPKEKVNKVIYANEDSANIKEISDKITDLQSNGIHVRFKEYSNLRYFIKSTSFKSENEYRFIYDAHNTVLQLANYNGLLSPYRDFSIDSEGQMQNLPIKIIGVYIGSNIPEYNTNIAILLDQTHEVFPSFFISESEVKEIR